jgi:hypothetical protein
MAFDQRRLHWNLKYEQGLPSLEKPDPFFVSAFNRFVTDQFPNGGTDSISHAVCLLYAGRERILRLL